jgi:hypothetical protein
MLAATFSIPFETLCDVRKRKETLYLVISAPAPARDISCCVTTQPEVTPRTKYINAVHSAILPAIPPAILPAIHGSSGESGGAFASCLAAERAAY